jgi:hypothetical protein
MRVGLVLGAAGALHKVGAAGGPMAAVAGLIGEQLGVERLPIEFSSEDRSHHVKIGEAAHVDVEDVVPFGVEGNEPAKVTDIFHPANSTLNVAQAGSSAINLFGLDISNEGKSAFSGTFSWAA